MKITSALIFGLTALSLTSILTSFKKQTDFDLAASIARGKDVYANFCMNCHMDEGQGLEGVYPPVAKADYLMADSIRAIRQIIYGVSEEMKVNGVVYNAEMLAVDLKDEEVSDVMNYVRNSFGNQGKPIKPEDVKAARKK